MMRLLLRQEFPLGRFHATPWRVNPFDDPFGEWPPSPWRLIRAVTARWYQWTRETEAKPDVAELERLQVALCKSTYAFYLPADARKGSPLRQYLPTEFGMDPPNWRYVARFQRALGSADGSNDATTTTDKKPAAKASRRSRKQETPEEKANKEAKAKIKGLKGVKLTEHKRDGHLVWEVTVKDKGADETKRKIEGILGAPADPWWRVADAGSRGYGTSLAQDNYWCIAPEAPVWWFIEGEAWTAELVELLDQCLARVIYFGRAETLTAIRLARESEDVPESNCRLIEQRVLGAVPVLTALKSATREDIERVTDDPASARRTVPPGAWFLYAVRPPRPVSRERRRVPAHRADCHLMQFALGWNVAPEPRAIVRLTSRFRSAVLRELLRLRTGDASATWSRVERGVRESIADMIGKDANDEPLKGHRHTEFLAWCKGQRPTRLLVWRGSRAFDEKEQEAILLAAARDVSWATAGRDADEWKVRLVPLDHEVPPPPGFDAQSAPCWESMTPYVPSRHHLRGGKERERESITAQVRRELALRGVDDVERVEIEQIGQGAWVAVHVPLGRAPHRPFLGDRRGYLLRLTFPNPVQGPLRLGHSSSFGLGLFRPSESK